MSKQDILRGRAYEKRLAKEREMKLIPLSGAGVFKEDLVGDHELLQAKSRACTKTYTLEKKDLISVAANAAMQGKIGVLFLEWGRQEYVILRRQDYEYHMRFDDQI